MNTFVLFFGCSKYTMYGMCPVVSVCIPVFNGEKYIIETVNSVMNQTFLDIEILIQDNCSSDQTRDLVIANYSDFENIKIVSNSHTESMADNWNKVINRATGKYIMLLSADDLLEKDFIESCLDVIRQYGVDIATTNYSYILGDRLRKRHPWVKEGIYCQAAGIIVTKNPFSINFSLLSQRAVEILKVENKLFQKNLYACDFEMWIRSGLQNLSIHYNTRCLGRYRLHEENLSNNQSKLLKQAIIVLLSKKILLKKYHNSEYKRAIIIYLGKLIVRRYAGKFNIKLLKLLVRELLV